MTSFKDFSGPRTPAAFNREREIEELEARGPRVVVRSERVPKRVREWLLRHVEMIRVQGDAVCPECNQPYNQHDEIEATFVLLCNGKLGKT